MATDTTYQRIVLAIEHPWGYLGEATHRWHCSFHLSGSTALTGPEAELTAVDLFEPIRLMSYLGGHLAEAIYYAMGSTASTWFKEYVAGDHPTAGSYWTPGGHQQQLEVCYLCEAPCGKNSRGKEVYLRKWIHGAIAGAADPNTVGSVTGTDPLNKWNTGAGPKALRPVRPSDGAIGGPWTYEQHLFTHQLRRGPKRKVVTKTEYIPVPLPL